MDEATVKAMGGPIVSKAEFLSFWEEYGKGNPMEAWLEVNYEIISKVVNFKGQKLTWPLIRDSWIGYIELTKKRKTEDKYIMSFTSFIKKGEYNSNFVAKHLESDPYYNRVFKQKKK